VSPLSNENLFDSHWWLDLNLSINITKCVRLHLQYSWALTGWRERNTTQLVDIFSKLYFCVQFKDNVIVVSSEMVWKPKALERLCPFNGWKIAPIDIGINLNQDFYYCKLTIITHSWLQTLHGDIIFGKSILKNKHRARV
jgi:hypothetical protein